MKRPAFRLLTVAVLLLQGIAAMGDPEDSTRNRRWYLPHYVPLQFAGNIGLISTGAGYMSNNRDYRFEVLYGYVPRSVAGTFIHHITAKNFFSLGTYMLRNNQSLLPYVGVGLSLEVAGNSFFKMPSHYPDSYYDFPKNLHAIVYGGARLQLLFEDDVRLFRGMELYLEAGTVDVYIWYKTISNEIRFHEIFSLALGVNFLLDYE